MLEGYKVVIGVIVSLEFFYCLVVDLLSVNYLKVYDVIIFYVIVLFLIV